MNINILSVSIETKPTAKGSYQQLEVAFKNLDSGKVESKKIMSFASKPVFDALSNAKAGDTFAITTAKNEKTGYWDWTAATQGVPGAVVSSNKTPTTPVKSTYETPEERAIKQTLIVRQSALGYAINTLSPGAKSALLPDAVVSLAEQYVEWVYGNSPTDVAKDIFDMPNDFPDVE